MSTDIEPVLYPGREDAIVGLVEKYKMALNNKKRRTLMNMNVNSFRGFEFGLIVSRCCRDLDLDGAFKEYMNAKEAGAVFNSETYCNLLSLTAGLGEQGSGQALIRDKEPPNNLTAALIVYEDMLNNKVSVPEASYTALIRCCCVNQQPLRGWKFYQDMQELNISPKLRTFTSLLDALSTSTDTTCTSTDTTVFTTTITNTTPMNNIECGFKLYNEMLNKYLLEPTEKEYIAMLRLCLAYADNRFYTILNELCDSGIIPINIELQEIMKKWFDIIEKEENYTITTSIIDKTGRIMKNNEQLLSLDIEKSYKNEFLNQLQDFAIKIDENRKIKMNNKVKEQHQINAMKNLLKLNVPITTMETTASNILDTNTKDMTSNMIVEGSDITTTGVGKGSGAVVSGPAAAASDRGTLWTEFVNYLSRHFISEPLQHTSTTSSNNNTNHTTSSSNSDSSSDIQPPAIKRTRYEDNTTIPTTTTTITATTSKTHTQTGFNIIIDGANVGYFKQNYAGAPNHVNYQQIHQLIVHLRSIGYSPLLILHSRHVSKFMIPDEKTADIVKTWRKEGYLYATPKGFNDDWFWLYASVKYQCKVVTNDEMRDHHFQLLSPKWFNRWRERNRVQFTFGVWQDQQLKQQQRSVISGSSNSACNSAKLLALRQMPVNLTTDIPSRTTSTTNVANGNTTCTENVQTTVPTMLDAPTDTTSSTIHESNNSDSSDGEDDFYSTENSQALSDRARAKAQRQAQMRRVSLRWPCPYSYCLQNINSNNYDGYYCPPVPVIDNIQTVSVNNALNANVFGITDENIKNEWLCIYKKK